MAWEAVWEPHKCINSYLEGRKSTSNLLKSQHCLRPCYVISYKNLYTASTSGCDFKWMQECTLKLDLRDLQLLEHTVLQNPCGLVRLADIAPCQWLVDYRCNVLSKKKQDKSCPWISQLTDSKGSNVFCLWQWTTLPLHLSSRCWLPKGIEAIRTLKMPVTLSNGVLLAITLYYWNSNDWKCAHCPQG